MKVNQEGRWIGYTNIFSLYSNKLYTIEDNNWGKVYNVDFKRDKDWESDTEVYRCLGI